MTASLASPHDRDPARGGDQNPDRDDPAPRSRRAGLSGLARAEAPSLVVGGVVAGYFFVLCLRLPWESDFALHMAVLGRLLAHPLHPGDPVLAIGGTSAYYTPYTVALMLLGKATGASALALYKFAGLVNTALLLGGLYRFVRTLSPARWAPPLALVGLASAILTTARRGIVWRDTRAPVPPIVSRQRFLPSPFPPKNVLAFRARRTDCCVFGTMVLTVN